METTDATLTESKHSYKIKP